VHNIRLRPSLSVKEGRHAKGLSKRWQSRKKQLVHVSSKSTEGRLII